MKLLNCSIGVFLILMFSGYCSWAQDEDPYRNLRRKVLDNGVVVYLSPGSSSKTVSVELTVGVGWSQIAGGRPGAAHVLEHALFRHPSLSKNMTYLQVIEEAGGEANGETSARETRYFATIKPEKVLWLIDIFNNMVRDRRFDAEEALKSRQEVLLEIGEADMEWLRLVKMLAPLDLPELGFWKTEFGLDEDRDSLDEERDATLRVEARDLQDLFDRYYYPGQFKLFVSGNFDEGAVSAQIEKTFGTLVARKGDRLKDRIPQPVNRPFLNFTLSSRDSRMSVGTKVWGVDAADLVSLHIYLEYLAHRLMKDIRNEMGQSYTPRAEIEIEKGTGYAAVALETTRDHFAKHLKLVRKMVKTEAEQGQLTDLQVSEAFSNFKRFYELVDSDSATLMDLARQKDRMLTDHQESRSSYEIFKSLSPQEFRGRLKKLFVPERRFEELEGPPALFRGEDQALWAISILLTVWLFRWILKRPFVHDQIRYVRKIKYSYLTLAKILAIGSLVLTLEELFAFGTDWLWITLTLRGSVWTNVYARIFFECFWAVGLLMGFLALFPRKIMVVGDQLVIKTLTYYSWSLPLGRLLDLELMRTLTAFRKLGLSVRVTHWSFVKPGVLIRVDQKFPRGYLFGFAKPKQVLEELSNFLPKKSTHSIGVSSEGDPAGLAESPERAPAFPIDVREPR